jgi:hypothetical protein
MDATTEPTRHALSQRVGALVDVFETIIYAIAFGKRVAGRRVTGTTADLVYRRCADGYKPLAWVGASDGDRGFR